MRLLVLNPNTSEAMTAVALYWPLSTALGLV